MRLVCILLAAAALAAAGAGAALDVGPGAKPRTQDARPGAGNDRDRAPEAQPEPQVRELAPRAAAATEKPARPTGRARPSPAPKARPRPARAPIGTFKLTYYWMASEKKHRKKRTTTLYARSCKPIAKVSRSFARRIRMQGTGRLRDGRVVNTNGKCSCPRSPCVFVASGKRRWGVGVAERPLSPFRSIAVDPRVVPIGTTVYVPELDGLAMPGRPPWGGFVHDGCLVADDRGGGVKGRKLDLFTGLPLEYRSLFGRRQLTRVTVYPGAGRCGGATHRRAATAERNAS